MNRQPCILVVRVRAALRAIAEASPNTRHVAGAAAAIVIVMDGEMPKIETFDEGRVAERILVAATAPGLASTIGRIMRRRRERPASVVRPAGRRRAAQGALD